MSRLVVSEFVSLDGVMEDPGGAEGFARGGWALESPDPVGQKFKLDELLAADVLLLGRITYEGFAAAWPGRTDEVGFAEKMNGMPKVVASTTLEGPAWHNTSVVRADVPGEVARLKEQSGGDILVAGSRTLVQTLLEHELVDELRLMIFPVVLGGGRTLFGPSDAAKRLSLAEATPLASGAVILVYKAG